MTMTMNMIMNITISITITITIIIVFIIITINITEAEEYKKLLDLESLRDIIKELQDTKLKLIVQVDELKEQIKTQRADHTDVYFYLNKKCDDAFETIESLEIQILKEHDERSKHESELNRYIDELKHKALQEGIFIIIIIIIVIIITIVKKIN